VVEYFFQQGEISMGTFRKGSHLKIMDAYGVQGMEVNLLDHHSLHEAMEGADTVYNMVSPMPDEDSDFIKVNKDGVLNLLEVATEMGVKTLIHLSTLDVCGFSRRDVSDASAPSPAGEYQKAKAEAERLLIESSKRSPLPRIVIIRAAKAVGSRDGSLTIPLLRMIRSGRVVAKVAAKVDGAGIQARVQPAGGVRRGCEMVQKGTVGDRGSLSIGLTLRRIRLMVYGSRDSRATALAQLQDVEKGDPFRILISTILSQRTRDENTTRASENLFSRYGTAEKLARANIESVRKLIRPSGFYNVKARSIIRVSGQLLEEFGGRVPDNVEDLLKLHSVGRKTANCVLVYGFNKPAIPVDTHVHRISNRLGLVDTRRPEETETQLVKKVPRRYWLVLNDLFVRFGQTTCKPVSPRCGSCTLRSVCRYYQTVVAPKG